MNTRSYSYCLKLSSLPSWFTLGRNRPTGQWNQHHFSVHLFGSVWRTGRRRRDVPFALPRSQPGNQISTLGSQGKARRPYSVNGYIQPV